MMGGKPTQSKDLGSSNLYSVLTILAALMLVPFGLVFEGPGVSPLACVGVRCHTSYMHAAGLTITLSTR